MYTTKLERSFSSGMVMTPVRLLCYNVFVSFFGPDSVHNVQ